MPDRPQINPVAIVVAMAVFFAILLIIGWVASRKSHDTSEDYYLTSGFGVIPLVGTITATIYSAWVIIGAFGAAYSTGLGFYAFFAGLNVTNCLFFWLLGTRTWVLGRRFGFITQGEFLGDYYGSDFIRIATVFIALAIFAPYAAIQLQGGGIMLEAFSGGTISFFSGVIAMVIVMAIFSFVGGARAVVWTDTFMAALMFFAMWFLLFYTSFKVGGFGAGWHAVANDNPNLVQFHNYSYRTLWSMIWFWMIAYYAMPQMWQRSLMAKSPKTIAKSAVLLPFVAGWGATLPSIAVGAFATQLIPGLTPQEAQAIVPLLCGTYLPIFGAVIICGAMAAMMSTVDSMLLTCSSIVTRDIYKKYMAPDASEATVKRVGQWVVVVFSVLLFVIAVKAAPDILALSELGVAFVVVLLPPLLGPLVWPRGTKAGAIASILAGTIVYWSISFNLFGTTAPLGWHAATWTLLFIFPTYYFVSLYTKPVPYSRQAEYHGLLTSVIYKNAVSSDATYTSA